MRNGILFVLFTLSLTSAARAETNHCHDEAANQTWEQVKHSHRGERKERLLLPGDTHPLPFVEPVRRD